MARVKRNLAAQDKNSQGSDLGVGYLSASKTILGIKCLKDYAPYIKTVGGESTISFKQQQNGNEIADSLGLKLSVSGTIFPFVQGNLAFSFAQSTQETSTSLTVNYLYDVVVGHRLIDVQDYGLNILSDFGYAAFLQGTNFFNKVCGDQFIIEQKIGTKFYMAVKYIFSSQSDKESFSSSIGATLNLFSILEISLQLHFSQMTEQQNTNLNLEISVYQAGGEVLEITKIYNKDDSNNYIALKCDIYNMEFCAQTISSIINYAKTSLVEQAQSNLGNINGNYAILDNLGKSYTSFGVNLLSLNDNPLVIAVRSWMNERFDNYTLELQFLQSLLYDSKVENMQRNESTIGYQLFNTGSILDYIGQYEFQPSYWSWSPDQIFTADRLSLIALYNSTQANLFSLSSANVGIPKCNLDANYCIRLAQACSDQSSCEYLPMQALDYSLIDAFKTIYQLITICDGQAFGRYIFPVSSNIYQEKAMFIYADKTTTTSNVTSTKYQILNLANEAIQILLYENELKAKTVPCDVIEAKNINMFPLVYEATWSSSDNRCADKVCPSGIVNEVDIILIQTGSLF